MTASDRGQRRKVQVNCMTADIWRRTVISYSVKPPLSKDQHLYISTSPPTQLQKKHNKDKMDQERHNQIMSFMTSFRTSVESNIKNVESKLLETNQKLDAKMDEMGHKVKALTDKMEQNDLNNAEAQKRMDDRLVKLEREMRKVCETKSRRDRLQLERLKTPDKSETLRNDHKTTKRTYQRRTIEPTQLVNEIGEEVTEVDMIEEDPLSQSTYRSTWAKELEQELSTAASQQGSPRNGQKTIAAERMESDDWRKPREQWEEIKTKENKTKRVRKPVILKDWFGTKNGDQSDSSDTSQDESGENEWTEVERTKLNEKKKLRKKNKIKEKTEELATRMQYMAGVGPIEEESIQFFENRNQNREQAMKSAVREYMKHYLSYNTEEIEELEIIETKQSKKDNIIYCVFGRIEDTKELHYRRASSENNDLIIRDYIPPQLYTRYMAIAKKATQKRNDDKTLKTQLRWGPKDIEIYLKTKGTDEPMRKINLKEFMESDDLPVFDLSIKWKEKTEQRSRRKLTFGQKRDLPSLRNQQTTGGIIRQHSTSKEDYRTKKARQENSLSEDGLSQENDEQIDEQL